MLAQFWTNMEPDAELQLPDDTVKLQIISSQISMEYWKYLSDSDGLLIDE